MSNFNTVTPTNESEEGDLYLLGRGTTSRTQKRDIVAAGIANARWSSEAVYLAGSNTVGSDGVNYQAVTDSGTGTVAGVIDPTTDTNADHWKKFVNYKESGGLVEGFIETNSFVKAPEVRVDTIKGLNTDLPLNLEPLTPDAYGSFNGIGVPSLLKNLNVSTVTRLTTGVYEVVLKNTMPDDNYVVLVSSVGNETAAIINSNNSFNIRTYDYDGRPYDRSYVSFIVYGGKL